MGLDIIYTYSAHDFVADHNVHSMYCVSPFHMHIDKP